ncbi:polysaccharide biosynthesis C-terminal domain-containing protein [Candidatus Woesearchaeota archaeon]|nr:polysaccharide biosynthesis C-terminal domain-containing protein [Candidatus Woesearchaeota archaeon]
MAGKKETIYVFGLGVLSKVITYVLLLVFANYFAKQEYGEASFVMSLFHLILYFSLIGIPYVLVPWIVKERDVHSVFYSLLFLVLAITGLGVYLSLDKLWIMPLVLSYPFLYLRGIAGSYLQARYRYDTLQISNTLFQLLTLGIVFFYKELGKTGIILGYGASYFIVSLFLIFVERKALLNLFSRFRFKFRTILEYAGKGLITSLLYVSFAFLNWIDSTILGVLSTFENVASYNVAGPISNIITMIPISLGMFLLTRSAELHGVKSARVLKRVVRISYTLSIITAIILISFIHLITGIFFPKYAGIELYITILTVGILFYCVYNLFYAHLVGQIYPEKALLPIGSAALSNILLDIILIPKYGLYGITAATMLSHILAFTLLLWKLGMLKNFWPVYLMSFSLFAVYYLGYYGILSLLAIVPLLFLFKLINKEDIKVMVETFRSILRT